MRRWMIVLIALLLVGLATVWAFLGRGDVKNISSSPVSQAVRADTSGFLRADGPRQFSFPMDHGPHPAYQTEWWYYTGNLDANDGRRFGYQLTFFRRALLPLGQIPQRSSAWATSQVYMAHFALSDIDGGNYRAFERLSRGAVGLASAQGEPFQVWLEDWRIEQIEADSLACAAPCSYKLVAAKDDIRLELRLKDLKGPIMQGDQGYSPKGPKPGQASYYYSLTRLETNGRVEIGGDVYTVSGLSWMDHEFSTSALSKAQVGWDWFSIQLEDNSELMVFQIRRADGSVDPFSSGTFIKPDGSKVSLAREDFNLEVVATWKSEASGATYPAAWTLRVPSLNLQLQIEPLLADQELNLSYAYWEGAVSVVGRQNGVEKLGKGYVELTGYSGSMGGEF